MSLKYEFLQQLAKAGSNSLWQEIRLLSVHVSTAVCDWMGVERFLFVLYIDYGHFVLFAKPFSSL